MADHLHKQIRDAAVTKLTGLTTTASRVYANRLYTIPESSLPALRVSLDDETVEIGSIHAPALLERRITLVVECCALDLDDLDDTCDQMQKEVEVALSAGITVAGLVLMPYLAASRFDDEPAALDAGVKRLEFALDFATPANAPDTLA